MKLYFWWNVIVLPLWFIASWYWIFLWTEVEPYQVLLSSRLNLNCAVLFWFQHCVALLSCVPRLCKRFGVIFCMPYFLAVFCDRSHLVLNNLWFNSVKKFCGLIPLVWNIRDNSYDRFSGISPLRRRIRQCFQLYIRICICLAFFTLEYMEYILLILPEF